MPNRFRKPRLTAFSTQGTLEASEIQPMPISLWSRILTGCFWFVMLLLPTGAGVWAVTNLLELPALPQCWAASWSDDSSSGRLYCAKTLADKQTAQDLAAAIQLLNAIPDDDPLREESDRLTKQWAAEIVQLGEDAFQAGKLEDAIAIAHQVPDSTLGNERIQHWQAIWDKAQKLYDDAKAAIDQRSWSEAFADARGLLGVGNRYWMAQHEDLMRQIQASKASQQQKPAHAAASPKPVEDLLTRMTKDQQAQADAHLAKARNLAKSGTFEGLKAAIDEAGQLLYGDPRYDEAQQAIASWQQRIETMEDRPVLNQAVALAKKGDEDSLRAAIDQASQIGWGRVLYDEAQAKMEQWQNQAYQLQVQSRSEPLNPTSLGDRVSPSSHPPINTLPPTPINSEPPKGILTNGGLGSSQPPVQSPASHP